MLVLTEHLLAVLGRAGFDDATALTVYRAFVAWNLGCLLVDKRQVVDNLAEPDPVLRLGLHRLSAADYPGCARWSPGSPTSTPRPSC